jgi:hypothetical protein
MRTDVFEVFVDLDRCLVRIDYWSEPSATDPKREPRDDGGEQNDRANDANVPPVGSCSAETRVRFNRHRLAAHSARHASSWNIQYGRF